MSCFIKKKLVSGASKDLYDVTEDKVYNNIFNALAWNVKFSILTLIATFLLWSRFKIPILKHFSLGLRRGEDLVLRGHHVKELKQKIVGLGEWWRSFLASTKSWILHDREFLVSRCGEAGYEYLTYQRYVAAFQFILCIIGLCLILPTNLLVGTAFPASSFSATTMSNLVPRIHYRFYWLHLIFSFSILPATLICMRLFFKHIDRTSDTHTFKISHTLHLSRLPKSMRDTAAIRDYFSKVFPGCQISDININLKITSLSNLEKEYHQLKEIIQVLRDSGEDEFIFQFNLICSCCTFNETQLAVEYYENKLARTREKLKATARRIFDRQKKLDSAFVQVESLEMARAIGKLLNTRTPSSFL
jgi:hypothetical protein